MKITVKARFNTQKQSIEKFGPEKYMMNLPFPEGKDAVSPMISILSRTLGVPPHRIEFVAVDSLKNWIFETDGTSRSRGFI